MDNIVTEKNKTFKELEKEIFHIACNTAVEITKGILEQRDQEIFEERDKKKHISEGFKKTSIKTIYGTVEYSRRGGDRENRNDIREPGREDSGRSHRMSIQSSS